MILECGLFFPLCLLQVYKRFVEIGRVALINDGPDRGKLCVIIDIVDQRRVCDPSANINKCISIRLTAKQCKINWKERHQKSRLELGRR